MPTRIETLTPDVKVALRLMGRHPLLTIVATAAMAFGLAATLGGLEIRAQIINPTLPLQDGDRVVGLRNWDIRRDTAGVLTYAEFSAWRGQLKAFEELGAARLVERNLIAEGDVEPIDVAAVTASAFRIAGVAPLLGRTFVDADESPGAAPVAVIGYSLWQRRFFADSHIVGRSIRLGAEQTTIVGVMPDRFGFPLAHQFWIPLVDRPPGQTPETSLIAFGRLGAGVTPDHAQVEFAALARNLARSTPEGGRFLRPDVVRYSQLFFDVRDWTAGLNLANAFLAVLILVVFANVALLMFARAASRESEIDVRTALGASRGRIVAQLFVEAIALSLPSTVVGVLGARFAVGLYWQVYGADSGNALPFWLNDRLTPSTVAYAVGLMLLGAVIAGVFPACKATGVTAGTRLRQGSPGGGGYRFGGVWTAAMASQVAVTVMFPAAAFFFHRWVVDGQTRDVGFPAGEYLSARLVVDRAKSIEDLRQQLAAEPGVTAVTFADRLPGMLHRATRFEVEGDDAPPNFGHPIKVASVDDSFFGAVNAPLVTGRPFVPADQAAGREVAIVNQSFVDRVLHGRNAIGRRVRPFVPGTEPSSEPWIEIVGVSRDLGLVGDGDGGLYRPLSPLATDVHVALHVRGAPEALTGRVRTIASRVDPAMRVNDIMTLDQVGADQWLESQFLSRLLVVLSGMALLLSLMAIYAVMAFTVVQRAREISTRMALGAGRRQIVSAVVRRPLMQIGIGVGAGTLLVLMLFAGLLQSTPTPFEAGLLVAYVTLMLGVCLSACAVPTWRALRLEPGQVLRG
jgi:predicted permease